MPRLIVNLDSVAALRNNLHLNQPDPVAAAVQTVLGGADGIAISLGNRAGQIRERDIRLLAQTVDGKLVLKMPPVAESVGMALEFKPHMVIVAASDDSGQEASGGLDLVAVKDETAEIVEPLKNSGIDVCLLIDPDPTQVKLAHKLDADAVEIDTRAFASAAAPRIRGQILQRITDTVKLAGRLPMKVWAGQGLDYQSATELAGLQEIDTFCLGRSIVARALLVGMTEAVREMRRRVGERG